MPGGRPSIYTEALVDTICQRLADGESLRQICASKAMPDRATVARWLDANARFATGYARAREAHADAVHDRMVEIEDDTLRKKVDPAAARTVLLSMQWRASKLAPKRYGDKIEATFKGPPLRELSDAELAVRVAQILKRSPEATAAFMGALNND